MYRPPDHGPSVFGSLVLKLLKKELGITTDGGYNFVDIRDVSKSIANAVSLDKSGEIYNLGGKFYSVKKIAAIIEKISGIKAPTFAISIKLISIIAPLIGWTAKRLGYAVPISQENSHFLRHGMRNIDSTKAKLNYLIKTVLWKKRLKI